jgi:acylphosphatase
MVMYRDFATRSARRLRLVGEVWNNADGSVSVVAEGERAALESLVLLLHKGSVLSAVENVVVVWGEVTGKYLDFTIRYKEHEK